MKKSFIHQQKEISFVKTTFTQYLKDKLDIIEVQGPILSKVGDGMQDNLSGIEHPVSVKVLQIPDETYEVVQSLAKGKRHTLARFGFGEGEGLFAVSYTHLRAAHRAGIRSILVKPLVEHDSIKTQINRARERRVMKQMAEKYGPIVYKKGI